MELLPGLGTAVEGVGVAAVRPGAEAGQFQGERAQGGGERFRQTAVQELDLGLQDGKPVDPEKEALVHVGGFAVLIVLMLAVSYHDITQIVSGKGAF